MPSRPRHLIWSAALVAAALALTGCGGAPAGTDADAGTLTVAAAFAPLADIARTVGGDAVEVVTITPPGVEPHDFELSADQVITIADADLVLSIPGFQPAVDEAIAQQAADRAVDATSGIELLVAGDDHADENEDHAHDGTTDPHIWLDPANVATIGHTLADALSAVDPDNAVKFQANANALSQEMDAIATKYRAALANCESTILVTSHGAFAYLANAFGFTQVGITGLTPEAEPSPARLAEITNFVKANGVTTIYTEELMSPRVAEVIAAETGAQVAVLNPIESLADGETIADVMRANLDVLADGQRCR